MNRNYGITSLALILVSACTRTAAPTLLPVTPPSKPTPTIIQNNQSDPTIPVIPPIAEAVFPQATSSLVEFAFQDLATRLDISIEQITLVAVESVDWPDASLGCPEDGLLYAQNITSGYRITLEARGTIFEYHSDRGPVIFLCLEGRPEFLLVIPILPGEKIWDGEPWMPIDPPSEGEIADPDSIK